jgi:hypothetical protein
MTEPLTVLIKPASPKREWLVRCTDSNDDLGVCAVLVSNGRVEIATPDDDVFTLELSQIAEFHNALHSAIDVAEADLRRAAV